jgi:predicted RNase H-like HicB family nuclease
MSHRYHVNVFWSEQDASWIADVPDLKGCSAWGTSPSAAITQVEQAIEGWLDSARAHGFPIPDARYRPAIYALREPA